MRVSNYWYIERHISQIGDGATDIETRAAADAVIGFGVNVVFNPRMRQHTKYTHVLHH